MFEVERWGVGCGKEKEETISEMKVGWEHEFTVAEKKGIGQASLYSVRMIEILKLLFVDVL